MAQDVWAALTGPGGRCLACRVATQLRPTRAGSWGFSEAPRLLPSCDSTSGGLTGGLEPKAEQPLDTPAGQAGKPRRGDAGGDSLGPVAGV